MSEKKIRTLIVEARRREAESIRESLATWSFFEIVGIAHSLPEAVDCVRSARPDIVILGIDGDAQAAIECCQQIKTLQRRTKIVLRVSLDEGPTLSSFRHLGIDGYLPATATPSDSRKIVRDAARGTLIFPTGIAHGGHMGLPLMRSPNLTGREKQILEQLSEGHRNQDIARSLGISEKTVETHVRHVLLKLGVDSRTRAVVWALRSGWYQSNSYVEG